MMLRQCPCIFQQGQSSLILLVEAGHEAEQCLNGLIWQAIVDANPQPSKQWVSK